MNGTTVCHYYVYTNGTCYFGNLLVSRSNIGARSGSQGVYVIPRTMLLFFCFDSGLSIDVLYLEGGCQASP